MKTIVLLAALALAGAAWAQEQKKEEAKPAAEEKAQPAAEQPKAAVAKRKPSPRRFEDARHCLDKGSNTEIIKCAEAYL
jgi:hypothetical protein